MNDDYRPCARGCCYRGKHLDECVWGNEQYDRDHLREMGLPECGGCMPARTVPETNLCTRCMRRLRDLLEDAPDLVAHIRSMIDPRKSGWNFDREKGSRPSLVASPSPMNVELIDASNEVGQILAGWAEAFGDSTVYHLRDGFPSTVTPEEAYGVASWASQYLVNNLDRIAGTSDAAWFSRHVLDFPEGADDWTIRKALARYPMEARAKWATEPCPAEGCGLRTIRVQPPRRPGDDTTYRCRSCGWEPPAEERETWAIYFEGVLA